MSTLLPSTDLTGAIVGSSFVLDFTTFTKFNPQNMQPAHLGLFNESGCGLNCVMKASGDSQYLPAGAWTVFEIEPNDSTMQATVTYTLPNPPVSQLNAVYYAPGEQIPQAYTLGNSPIGIGGSVAVSSVQTLSNEGSASNLLVIDMGDTAFTQVFTLYNDGHSLWAVDQSGVKHQVIKVQTTGNPLQLGATGDTTEVLGSLTIDQNETVTGTSTFTGDATFNGAGTGVSVTNNETVGGTLGVTGATTLTGGVTVGSSGILAAAATDLPINVDTGKTIRLRVNGGNIVNINSTDFSLLSSMVLDIGGKKINDGSANNLADWTAGGLYLKGNPSSNGVLHYQADGTNTDWTLAAMSTFTGSATGTFNHGLKAAGASIAPDIVLPMTDVSGSQTMGYDSVTSTQVHITVFSSLGFKALAMKF